MNYNVLRYFSVLAQVENYTKAAARLGISQPSLSSAIHNLENELGGVALFEKVGRNIRLTKEGHFYREKVDSALSELHAASLMLKDSRESAPVVIRMGYVSGTLDAVVLQKIREYTERHSRVRFLLTEHSAQELMDQVRQEQLDMAIVDSSDRDRSLHFRKLRERGFYVALPKGHPLEDREYLEPLEVMELPQVVFNYSVEGSFGHWASGNQANERVICTVNTASSALDLVGGGLGVSFIPDECVLPRDGVSFVPLRNWHQALYMCILYDKWLQPMVWDFCELVISAIRKAEEERKS